MKKFVSLVILILGVSVYSFAQLQGGFKGGLNYSDLIITTTVDSLDNSMFRAKPGYNVGCFVNLPFSEGLGMQAEVLFSNKGYKKKAEGSDENVAMNYISWPVMFYYRPAKKLDLEIGPEFGLLVSPSDIIKSFDLGIDVGVRYYITDMVDIAFRYNMGMPAGFKSQQSFKGDIPGSYANSTFQLTVGISLFKEKSGESGE